MYTYKSNVQSKKLPLTDTQLLNVQEGKELVTLITCGDMNAVTRLVVQGELEKITPMKEATQEMKKSLRYANANLLIQVVLYENDRHS